MKDDAESGLETAFQLWAKTDRDSDRWHALPFHLVDVGAAAKLLWDYLPEGSRDVATRAFGNEDLAARVVVFLAAVHDMGKANRFFQAKDPRQLSRLEYLGVVTGHETHRHGQATGALLSPWIASVWQWSRKAASSVAVAVGGHHGVFLNDLNRQSLDLDRGYMPRVASGLLAALHSLYELPSDVPEPANLNPLLGWLAGFVAVADWLGSNERMLTWSHESLDLRAYSEEALVRAGSLFREINWAQPHGGPPVCVRDLVPEGFEPNNLQRVAGEVALGDFGLAIVEAPTGEGKTEAAFALSEPGRALGEGMYFALPTMATANGLHLRVRDYLQRATGVEDVETRLLHSQAWLYQKELRTVSNPSPDEVHDEAEDWFMGTKRGLLVPYGVGTIDQCLVAALRAKHAFIRLFALAGKTVVVDEVHAYDVYMSDLLMRLLGWLRGLGCRVVLLSATLPTSRRQGLIQAWGGGDHKDLATYPCITWVDAQGSTKSRRIRVAARKHVSFELIPSDDDEAWMAGVDRVLESVVTHGGLGALILNTVKDAQAAYVYLSRVAPEGIEVDLFHARYTMEDRAQREKEVLAVYGKQGARRKARILVATQVVEQSLDLDFDHMASALAPIDLLIQRAGRLHRHRRTVSGRLHAGKEPDERPAPTLHIISPRLSEARSPKLEDRVYAHDVLLKTLSYLERGFVIRDPSDVSTAVDWVYENAAQETDRAEWQQRLNEATIKAEAKRARHHDLARDAMICNVQGWYLLTEQPNGFDENDEVPGSQAAARTRLEELPSVSLVLFFPKDQWPPHPGDPRTRRSLALRTVRAPVYGDLLQEILGLPKPSEWDRLGPSKYAVPLRLDDDGQGETDSFRFQYSREVGLAVQRKYAQL